MSDTSVTVSVRYVEMSQDKTNRPKNMWIIRADVSDLLCEKVYSYKCHPCGRPARTHNAIFYSFYSFPSPNPFARAKTVVLWETEKEALCHTERKHSDT